MIEGRERFTDVLGELVEISDRSLVVRRDDGSRETISAEVVVAAKPVPPRPVKYSEIAALERVGADHWPAPDTEWLGGWLLRAASGWTRRGNSALPLGDPGMPLKDAVARVGDWYGARGLPPAFAVPLPLSRGVGELLRETGWEEQVRVEVRTRALADWVSAARPDLPPVRIDSAPSMDALSLVSARRGELPQVALTILGGPPKTGFAILRLDDAVAAIGRGVVSEGWLGLSLIDVAVDARRRGLGTYIMGALMEWGRELGAERAYLQVEDTNAAALAMYDRLGFTVHHTYVNWGVSAA
ncbi:GNAT family N-acetyltransferase [Actinorhabdospora filicis]|uniref:GNAT family N-acetyltransferase n=1 Tax=Actinorhabdospora filicis TaxID=1785913 RepID=UPI00255358ED|nr:GNAT family N-acetyltransferase [Actinorhabdospora filicis]